MRQLKIVPRSTPRQYQPPIYEILHVMSGFWVCRSDGACFQLVEKFTDFESAADFMAFCNEVAAAPRRLAGH